MWRTQKDPETALRVAIAVMDNVPGIRVSIGRRQSWLDEQHSPPEFRRRVNALATTLRDRARDRVQLLDHFASPADYWRMLGTVDISYTCSREESFGIAMVEHAAAGAACVCPNALCYPETQQQAYLTPPTEACLVDAICKLATDPALLDRVRSRGQTSAARYSIDATVRAITGLFGVEQPGPADNRILTAEPG